MRHRTIILAAVCALWACAGPSGPAQETLTGTPLRGGKVSVLEFSRGEDALVKYHRSTDAFGLAVAEEIASQLRRRGHEAEAVPSGGRATGDVVVEGEIIRIDGGSRAQRYWVGFGAGAAKFGVAGVVTRADGAPVGTFSHERWSGFGVFGGATEGLMQRCIRATGADIAKMIDSGSYARVKE